MIESIQCPCGGHYKPNNKSKHFKTKKHQKWSDLPEVKKERADKTYNLLRSLGYYDEEVKEFFRQNPDLEMTEENYREVWDQVRAMNIQLYREKEQKLIKEGREAFLEDKARKEMAMRKPEPSRTKFIMKEKATPVKSQEEIQQEWERIRSQPHAPIATKVIRKTKKPKMDLSSVAFEELELGEPSLPEKNLVIQKKIQIHPTKSQEEIQQEWERIRSQPHAPITTKTRVIRKSKKPKMDLSNVAVEELELGEPSLPAKNLVIQKKIQIHPVYDGDVREFFRQNPDIEMTNESYREVLGAVKDVAKDLKAKLKRRKEKAKKKSKMDLSNVAVEELELGEPSLPAKNLVIQKKPKSKPAPKAKAKPKAKAEPKATPAKINLEKHEEEEFENKLKDLETELEHFKQMLELSLTLPESNKAKKTLVDNYTEDIKRLTRDKNRLEKKLEK